MREYLEYNCKGGIPEYIVPEADPMPPPPDCLNGVYYLWYTPDPACFAGMARLPDWEVVSGGDAGVRFDSYYDAVGGPRCDHPLMDVTFSAPRFASSVLFQCQDSIVNDSLNTVAIQYDPEIGTCVMRRGIDAYSDPAHHDGRFFTTGCSYVYTLDADLIPPPPTASDGGVADGGTE